LLPVLNTAFSFEGIVADQVVNTLVGNRQFNATTLAPGSVQTFSMSIRLGGLPKNEPVQVSSTLDFGAMGQGITPHFSQ
jgi:hypothetical protein